MDLFIAVHPDADPLEQPHPAAAALIESEVFLGLHVMQLYQRIRKMLDEHPVEINADGTVQEGSKRTQFWKTTLYNVLAVQALLFGARAVPKHNQAASALLEVKTAGMADRVCVLSPGGHEYVDPCCPPTGPPTSCQAGGELRMCGNVRPSLHSCHRRHDCAS